LEMTERQLGNKRWDEHPEESESTVAVLRGQIPHEQPPGQLARRQQILNHRTNESGRFAKWRFGRVDGQWTAERARLRTERASWHDGDVAHRMRPGQSSVLVGGVGGGTSNAASPLQRTAARPATMVATPEVAT